MPIPEPRKDEKEEDFISRCMGDETMKKEYEDNDQRLAVCYSKWREKDEEGSTSGKRSGDFHAFTHNSTVDENEPDWGSVDKTKLPRSAHADQGEEGKKSTWGYPHHWVKDGSDPDEDGIYTKGTMYLHRGGLAAAWAAAQGARQEGEASQAIKSHLNAHRKDIGMGEEARSFYKIRAQADDEEAEILLYGDIGESWFEEGNGAKKFVEDLKAVKNAKRLSIRINSGGGSVFDGMAIFNAIDRHSSKKTVHIDGLAASIASVVAMAGDSIIMAENAMFMIHKPFGATIGNAIDMRKMAEALDKVEEGMITSYQRKSRLSGTEISQMMADETWMTAKEALEKGFVTQVGKPMQMAASVKLDPSRYKNMPKSFLLPQAGSDGPEAMSEEELEARFQKFKPDWSTEALLKKR